jgi:hypothetical protein
LYLYLYLYFPLRHDEQPVTPAMSGLQQYPPAHRPLAQEVPVAVHAVPAVSCATHLFAVHVFERHWMLSEHADAVFSFGRHDPLGSANPVAGGHVEQAPVEALQAPHAAPARLPQQYPPLQFRLAQAALLVQVPPATALGVGAHLPPPVQVPEAHWLFAPHATPSAMSRTQLPALRYVPAGQLPPIAAGGATPPVIVTLHANTVSPVSAAQSYPMIFCSATNMLFLECKNKYKYAICLNQNQIKS